MKVKWLGGESTEHEGEFILQMCSFLVSKNVMPLQKNIPKLSNKETLKAKSLETVFERYPPILAVSQSCHIWNKLEESPLWRSSVCRTNGFQWDSKNMYASM